VDAVRLSSLLRHLLSIKLQSKMAIM